MSLLKKTAAIALTSAMALSLASCGKDTTWGANIDGTQLRAGILIYFQSNALSEAYTHMIETDTDVLSITIENKPAKEWINDEAVKSMQEYVAVENKFNELGLTFENNEDKAAVNTVDQWWEYVKEYFEGIGVSKQSYLDIVLNSEKRTALFEHYYGEGGELEVSADELKTYLSENNARVKYIEMPLKDGEGNLLKSDGKAEIKAMAEEYIERMNTTDVTFEEISKEYNDYYTSLISAAAGIEQEPVEVESTSDESEEVNYGTVISKESAFPSTAVSETVFGDLAVNEYTIVEEDEVYYIVYKMDLFADETYFENERFNALYDLKNEEFNETVAVWTANQAVERNEASFERYKIEKLVEEE